MYGANCAHIVMSAPPVHLRKVRKVRPMRIHSLHSEATSPHSCSSFSKSAALSPAEGSMRKGNGKMMSRVDDNIKAYLALSLDIVIEDEG